MNRSHFAIASIFVFETYAEAVDATIDAFDFHFGWSDYHLCFRFNSLFRIRPIIILMTCVHKAAFMKSNKIINLLIDALIVLQK